MQKCVDDSVEAEDCMEEGKAAAYVLLWEYELEFGTSLGEWKVQARRSAST